MSAPSYLSWREAQPDLRRSQFWGDRVRRDQDHVRPGSSLVRHAAAGLFPSRRIRRSSIDKERIGVRAVAPAFSTRVTAAARGRRVHRSA